MNPPSNAYTNTPFDTPSPKHEPHAARTTNTPLKASRVYTSISVIRQVRDSKTGQIQCQPQIIDSIFTNAWQTVYKGSSPLPNVTPASFLRDHAGPPATAEQADSFNTDLPPHTARSVQSAAQALDPTPESGSAPNPHPRTNQECNKY